MASLEAGLDIQPDTAEQASIDETFTQDSLWRLQSELKDPPILHVIRQADNGGLPYARGVIRRFDTAARQLPSLVVVRLIEPAQGVLDAS